MLSDVAGAKEATGLVVIIDVLRAATVAAYLLNQGVLSITPVASKEEAFSYQEINPNFLLVGEEMGIKIEGFDIGNSPKEIKQLDNLKNKHVIHRSTTGTQGLVNSDNADEVIFGTFVTTKAIADYLLVKNPKVVSLVSMGGLEDELFAEFLRGKLLNKRTLEIKEVVTILENHDGCQWFLDPKKTDFPSEDFYLSLETDVFSFFPILHRDKIVKSTFAKFSTQLC